MNHRLVEVLLIQGRIEVVTGLRIGASAESMEISGLDNPILRNPATLEPFIPGSSLRGRMRSLAEWFYGELPASGDPTKPAKGRCARVFGVAASDSNKGEEPSGIGPTRLLVRDAALSQASRERLQALNPITEVKSENSINRLTAKATPRPMERVLPGVSFDLELVYRIFDLGDGGREDREAFEVVKNALALVELDALGGGGSRGNGKVLFKDLQCNGAPLALPSLPELKTVGAA